MNHVREQVTIADQLSALEAEETTIAATIAAIDAGESLTDAQALTVASAPIRYRQIEQKRARLLSEQAEAAQVEHAAQVEAQRQQLANMQAERRKLEARLNKQAEQHLSAAAQVVEALDRERRMMQALGDEPPADFSRLAELQTASLQLLNSISELGAIKTPSLPVVDKLKAWVSSGLSAEAATRLESVYQRIFEGDLATHRRIVADGLAIGISSTASAIARGMPQNTGAISAAEVNNLQRIGISQQQLNEVGRAAHSAADRVNNPNRPEPEAPAVDAAPAQKATHYCPKCGQPLFRPVSGMACPRCGHALR